MNGRSEQVVSLVSFHSFWEGLNGCEVIFLSDDICGVNGSLTLSALHKTIVLHDQNIAILSWGSAYKVK